jgi:putative ABC transport system permease protein
MRFSDILRTAIFSLRGNWMRSALTSLGMIIGIAAVIVMVSVGQGTQAQIDKQMSGLGAQRLDIMPGSGKGPPGAGGARQSASSFFTRRGRRGGHPRAGARGAVRGRSAARQRAGGVRREQRLHQLAGRAAGFLLDQQLDAGSGPVVRHPGLRQCGQEGDPRRHRAPTLFGEDSGIGQSIRLGRVPFEVVGTLKPKGRAVSARTRTTW